jgi:hypothetical protein
MNSFIFQYFQIESLEKFLKSDIDIVHRACMCYFNQLQLVSKCAKHTRTIEVISKRDLCIPSAIRMLICQNNKSRSNLPKHARTAQNKKRRKKSQSMNVEREQSAASARNIIMKNVGV